MGSIFFLVIVVLYRTFFFNLDHHERGTPTEGSSQVARMGNIDSSAEQSVKRVKGKATSRDQSFSPCQGMIEPMESMKLFELDLKKDDLLFSTLMDSFDDLEKNILTYDRQLEQRGRKANGLCSSIREQIFNLEYIFSVRGGEDERVKEFVLIKYTSLAYLLLEKRTYPRLVQAAGLFMNIGDKNFFTQEQLRDLSYIYNRIRDDYRVFQLSDGEGIDLDKNGDADYILLRDWIAGLD